MKVLELSVDRRPGGSQGCGPREKRGFSPEMAVLLSVYFGTSE